MDEKILVTFHLYSTVYKYCIQTHSQWHTALWISDLVLADYSQIGITRLYTLGAACIVSLLLYDPILRKQNVLFVFGSIRYCLFVLLYGPILREQNVLFVCP